MFPDYLCEDQALPVCWKGQGGNQGGQEGWEVPIPPWASVAWQPHPLGSTRMAGPGGSPWTAEAWGGQTQRSDGSRDWPRNSPKPRYTICGAQCKMKTQGLFLKNYSEFQRGSSGAQNKHRGPL